jgi:hypothetical protein
LLKKEQKEQHKKQFKRGIKTGAKIAGKFDETIPMGFKPIQEIPKVGIPKQTLTKAQRLAASKAAIKDRGKEAGKMGLRTKIALGVSGAGVAGGAGLGLGIGLDKGKKRKRK